MPNLPPDLVEEILSRVPATALTRFRSTSKGWDALFKDQRFSKKHFDRAPKQFWVLMLNKRRVSSLSVNLHGIDIDAPFIEFKGELSLKDSSSSSRKVDIFSVFHCDGLLLCHTENDRLVVWNPCTGETKCIKPRNSCGKSPMFCLGYESKNSSCRNYKLLRYILNRGSSEYEIYDFSTSSWRILNVTTKFFILTHGVSLKGNTYWIDERDDSIVCFDFSIEKHGLMSLPFEESCLNGTALTTVREEQLSVLHKKIDTSKIEIWVTTNDKIDQTVVLSWSRIYAIDLYKLSRSDNLVSCWLSFFIDDEKEVVVYCGRGRIDNTIRNKVSLIGEYGVYREKYFGEPISESGQAFILNYVPSLASIQQGTLHT